MKKEDKLHFLVCEWLNSGSNRSVRFVSNIIERIPSRAARIKAVKLNSKEDKHPDILITTPSCGYHGLAMELKAGEDKLFTKKGVFRLSLSETTYPHIRRQHDTLKDYYRDGYFSCFSCNAQESKNIISAYLHGNTQYLESTLDKYKIR